MKVGQLDSRQFASQSVKQSASCSHLTAQIHLFHTLLSHNAAPLPSLYQSGRLLSGVFQAINRNKHNKGVLSLDEVIAMAAKLEIFLTEDEAERIFALMDGGSLKDGKVTEADFIGFMKKR